VGPPIIRFSGVSLSYKTPTQRYRSFKDYLIRRVKGDIEFRHRWALKDINLDVHKGEILGIVGHNGAGKSTLLKVAARILAPTEGRVVVQGQVSPLMGIGAGFHPELTGRENVFLNGTMLGRSRAELEDRFDHIVEFAELEDFIDAPLRTYSTGMRARLGFAVATDTQPDILIVDEVLAVGDASFRQKSADRMKRFRDSGTTILLVTHSMPTMEAMAHRLLWIHNGKHRMVGPTEAVLDKYLQQQERRRKRRAERLTDELIK
jgi:ABC-type polysaccharide/polyol phosphate transport system ATPase subunit